MSYASTVLGLSPAAFWRLAETSGTSAADASGNGHGGTYAGGFTLGLPSGNADASFSTLLDGSTGRITTSYSPFAVGSTITIAGWAKRQSSTSADTLFGGGAAASPLLRAQPGSNDVLFGPDATAATQAWTAALPGTGTWFHWALVYSDATKQATLYVNGVSQGTKTFANGYNATAGNVELGARAGTGDAFDGYLQDVAVWTSALTSDQIGLLYLAGAGLLVAPAVIPNLPQIRLQAITPAGQGYDLTDQAEALSWSSTNPGGDERCTFNLKRKWFAGAPEIAQGNTLRVTDRLDVLWQGRIEENDRAVQDSELIGVTAYGLGIALKDTESYRDIIVDQDMSAWGGPPLNRQAALGSGNISFGDFSWTTDPASGLICALPNQALGAQTVAEAWYIAPPGVLIAKAYYKGSDTGLPAGWETPSLVDSPDDAATSIDSNAVTFDGTLRTVTLTNARRYLRFREYSNGTASTPAAGANRRLTMLALYGNHGLTLTDPGDGNPFGVLASNVVPYIVGKATGITARRIDATTFVIPQLAWRDGVSLEQAITDATQFDSVDWGTWGPCTALDMSTGGYFDMTAKDPSTQHWFIPRSDCDDIALNVELATLYNSVDVIYQDASGQQQVVTRTAAVPTLSAISVTRKARLDGGTLTTAGANQLGDAFLALSSQQPPARGSVTISAPLTHYRRGKLPPHYMRANGSNLRVPDVLPSSDLFSLSAAPDRRTTFPVKRVSVDASGAVPKVTVEVDQANDTLARLTARLQTEVAVAVGQGS